MATNKKYDMEFKLQALKLAKEIGQGRAASELGIPKNTLYTWTRDVKLGKMDSPTGTHTVDEALSLTEELRELRKRVKEQDREIRELKEMNEFLEEASAFFAASRRKSAKNKG